jgi:hypothetical protein
MTSVIPGKILSRRTTPSAIIELSTNPPHLLDEQKEHFRKVLQKRKRIYGVLQGRQQEFTVAFIEEENRTVLLDGYLRGNALAAGEVIPDSGFPYYLRTHFVKSREEANVLFEQYNQLSADKRVETALREAGVFKKVTSGLLRSRGRATAIQLAAGLRSSRDVKDATRKFIPDILAIDQLGLERNLHEFAGSLGSYLAAFDFAPNFAKPSALKFISLVNKGSTLRARAMAKNEIDAYTSWLRSTPIRTGAGANKEAFERGLFTAAAFMYKHSRKKLPKAFQGRNYLTHAEFVRAMGLLSPKEKASTEKSV